MFDIEAGGEPMNWRFWQRRAENSGENPIDLNALSAMLTAAMGVPPAGRSSNIQTQTILNGLNQYFSIFGDMDPAIPWTYLNWLSRVVWVNPTMKHALENWKTTANSGHTAFVEARNDNIAEASVDALNALARRVNPYGAGMDGLVDKQLLQTGIGGAVSAEAVIANDLSQIDDIVLVPVESIRFKQAGGQFVPFQRGSMLKDIDLNPLTYKYTAWEHNESNPYAVPPMLAAIQPVLDQADMNENIRFIIKKLGLLGLVSFVLKPLAKRTDESDREYQNRLADHLSTVSTNLNKNFLNGLIVHYDDQEVKHNPTTGNVQGADKLYMLNVHEVSSAMLTPPAFVGHTDSSTETYADVVYRLFVALAKNLRRPCKRSMEFFWRLELRLQGIEVDSISAKFADIPSRDPLATLEGESFRQNSIIQRVEKGMIDPDTGAQEMGYDRWFDPSRIPDANAAFSGGLSVQTREPYRFKYDRERNLYVFQPRRIELQSAGTLQHTHSHNCNHVLAELGGEWSEVAAKIDGYIASVAEFSTAARESAVSAVLEFLEGKSASDFVSAEAFGRDVFNVISESYHGVFDAEEVAQAIRAQVNPIYSFFKLEDMSGLPAGTMEFVFNSMDRRAITFIEGVDHFMVSKFIDNPNSQAGAVKFLREQYLEKGEGLFGRGSKAVIEQFRGQFGTFLKDRSSGMIKTIMETSVTRMRGYARIQQFTDAGFARRELIVLRDACDICAPLANRPVETGPAAETMEMEIAMTPEEFSGYLKARSNKIEDVQARYKAGETMTPLHPNCRCQERVVIDDGD